MVLGMEQLNLPRLRGYEGHDVSIELRVTGRSVNFLMLLFPCGILCLVRGFSALFLFGLVGFLLLCGAFHPVSPALPCIHGFGGVLEFLFTC